MPAPEELNELVERFKFNEDSYKKSNYNETQVRREFIDPLFKLLGWDVDNTDGDFWFSFTFESDKNANEIADYIRPYVSNGNAGCSAYNGKLLSKENFDVHIDITQSTTEVTAQDVDPPLFIKA